MPRYSPPNRDDTIHRNWVDIISPKRLSYLTAEDPDILEIFGIDHTDRAMRRRAASFTTFISKSVPTLLLPYTGVITEFRQGIPLASPRIPSDFFTYFGKSPNSVRFGRSIMFKSIVELLGTENSEPITLVKLLAHIHETHRYQLNPTVAGYVLQHLNDLSVVDYDAIRTRTGGHPYAFYRIEDPNEKKLSPKQSELLAIARDFLEVTGKYTFTAEELILHLPDKNPQSGNSIRTTLSRLVRIEALSSNPISSSLTLLRRDETTGISASTLTDEMIKLFKARVGLLTALVDIYTGGSNFP